MGKCMTCPKGTCRYRSGCVCPNDFLENDVLKNSCLYDFRKEWPASVGMDDPDQKECTQPSNEPEPSDISCCSLTEYQLWELRGWGKCPNYFLVINLDGKCERCPPGTCRLNDYCRCPDAFLHFRSLQKKCRDSFSVSWPESIGREDVNQRSC